MRELKFRAWDGTKLVYDNVYNDTWSKMYNLGEFFRELEDKYPIMQCIGLKDKNDTEIYEGDILYTHRNNGLGGLTTKIGKVEYRAPVYGVTQIFNEEEYFMDFNNYEELEVVGNIYEQLKERD